MRVLLVEDNRALRALLSQMLRPVGMRIVFECGTQHEALAWLEAHCDGWDLALVASRRCTASASARAEQRRPASAPMPMPGVSEGAVR